MAKSDFNFEDDNDFNPNSNQQNLAFNDNSNNKSSKFVQDEFSDYSDFGTMSYDGYNSFVDDSNVVFEEDLNQTPEEKLKYKLSIINKRVVLLIVLVVMIVLILGIVVYLVIAKNIASYKSEIIIPDIVYLEETASISVIAEGNKNLEKTVSNFTSSNSNIATILNETMKGKDVLNTIVPIQTGVTTIEVKSVLENKKMGLISKEIHVCPAFKQNLINSKTISVQKSSSVDLNINFGEGKCAENIFYESSNEQIFTVTSEGKVEGINTGSALLTIRKGQRFFTVPVYVTDNFVSMTSISSDYNKLQLMPNQSMRLFFNYFPYNATTQNIDFYSDDSSIVSIDEFGVVTAHKEGATTIKITNGNRTADFEVTVIVSKGVSKDGTKTEKIVLSKKQVNLIQGNSEKINALVAPDNAKDKTLTWSTENSTIADVNSYGVIFAKNPGRTIITVKNGDNISESIEVVVNKMKSPVIKTSDNVVSGNWHTNKYKLSFFGSDSGVTYYYGTNENSMTLTGDEVKVNKDGVVTYYVKACRENFCSGTATYFSKLDANRPLVVTVVGAETSRVSEDVVHIALRDSTSLIKSWCVNSVNDALKCKWNDIVPVYSPVVRYTVKKNGTYYVFAKDNAGNISKSYDFKISNIAM